MRRNLVGVALLLACGGRAGQLEGEPGGFAPDGSSSPAGGAGQPMPARPAPGRGSTPRPGNPPVTMMPQTPVMPAPMTPQQPDPPGMVPDPPAPDPEPPVIAPEPNPCSLPYYLDFYAADQSALDALEGCEELERLAIFAPLDLRRLASLRRVGSLFLTDVASLAGLENLEQANTLVLTGAALRSAQPLSSLRYVTYLRVDGTSLFDLSGLGNVRAVTTLFIQNNPQLQSLDGLNLEELINDAHIIDNAVLRDATSLDSLRQVWTLEIARNPQLTVLPVFSQLTFLDSFLLTDSLALLRAPEFPSITNLTALTVWYNTALERVAFPALESVSSLSVYANPSLVDISLPRLTQAGYVDVYYNPALDGVALGNSLASVITSSLHVAPDQTQAQLDPCPWTADDVCDEYVMCAPGTDPVCPRYE